MSRKTIVLLVLVMLVVILVSIRLIQAPMQEVTTADLPWKINSDNPQQSDVFSLHIGLDDLATTTESIKKIPLIAIFKNPDESILLEAYFSKVKHGPLQGSLAVEVDIEGVDLGAYARFDKPGKPMPSGKRQFLVSKTGIISANKLRSWKLAYLPSTNYSEAQLHRFFGKPESILAITKDIENWHYPAKGLIITYDKEGREVFYYSARAEYTRLTQSIAKQYATPNEKTDGSTNE